MRLSTIAVFTSIALVLSGFGLEEFISPESATTEQFEDFQFGLRLLFVVFPAAALLIGILIISRYDLYGGKLQKIKDDLHHLHQKKGYKALENVIMPLKDTCGLLEQRQGAVTCGC